MKFVKYTVKVPKVNLENEYNEFIFYTLEEVCKFLDTNFATIYKIISGEFKCTYKTTMKLKGIIITKEEIPKELKEELKKKYDVKKKERKEKELTVEEKKISEDFQKELLNKYQSVV